MKKILLLLVLAGAVGSAAWIGLTRDASAEARPEVLEKIALAERFLERQNPAKALEAIQEVKDAGYQLGERGSFVHLKALDAKGRHGEAANAAERFLKAHPNSEHARGAKIIHLSAELASSGLTRPDLQATAEEFLRENSDTPGAGRLQVALARLELGLGDYTAAERRLSGVLDRADKDADVFQLASALGEANMERLFSRTPGPDDTVYTVKSGDTINRIANSHGITEELLMGVNGISDPRRLRVGQQLKVPNVSFSLHVDIGTNLMELRNHGRFFKLYSVRTGREEGTTPTGTFRVLNKKRDPTWRPGNGYVYHPGDPNNELSTRWMAFQGDILGIHGTIHPETVGDYASNGCVGMLTEEVEELFDMITVGTPLEIKGVRDLERHRVIPSPGLTPPREMASN
ncbi:MAG: L,D-transpeptidase family protein [Candidatus Sumerlaeia bacterium]|nr:L,D-transpeptidase family protein [Candidatus Sumerlaeia bacterium]